MCNRTFCSVFVVLYLWIVILWCLSYNCVKYLPVSLNHTIRVTITMSVDYPKSVPRLMLNRYVNLWSLIESVFKVYLQFVRDGLFFFYECNKRHSTMVIFHRTYFNILGRTVENLCIVNNNKNDLIVNVY